MKHLFSVLLFLCAFTVVGAQSSQVEMPKQDVKQKIVQIDSVLYLETTTVDYQLLGPAILQEFDAYEQSIDNFDRQKQELIDKRKEYTKLLKQAIKNGYEPIDKNERGQFLRIKEKIEKEKL